MVKSRPNEDCLYCGAKLTRPPSLTRSYYYCNDACWRPCNRSLNFFNPEILRRNGTPMQLLATFWWILKNAKTPLPADAIHERMHDLFGNNERLTSRRHIHRLKGWFKADVIRKHNTKKPVEYEATQNIPFKDALKPKFASVIAKYEKQVAGNKVNKNVRN